MRMGFRNGVPYLKLKRIKKDQKSTKINKIKDIQYLLPSEYLLLEQVLNFPVVSINKQGQTQLKIQLNSIKKP